MSWKDRRMAALCQAGLVGADLKLTHPADLNLTRGWDVGL
jgi:hypothetical protein